MSRYADEEDLLQQTHKNDFRKEVVFFFSIAFPCNYDNPYAYESNNG